MSEAPDPIVYVLQKELAVAPGSTFNYSGGTTQILAEIVKRTTGQDVYEFAINTLFEPLGITDSYWTQIPNAGLYAAASGLRLTPRDMLKFGFFYRGNGEIKGTQLLPADWVSKSFQRQSEFDNRYIKTMMGYGYQFWIWNAPVTGVEIVGARGNGDQNILWIDELDLIIVSTAGNYNNWSIDKHVRRLVHEHILAAIKG